MAARKNKGIEEIEEKKTPPAVPDKVKSEAEDDEPEVVELSDGDEDDDEPDERPSRKERRSQRRENYEQMQRERDELKQRSQQYEQQFAQMQAWQQHQAQQVQIQQQGQQDPDEEKIYEDQQALFAWFESVKDRATEATLQQFDRRAREIEKRKYQHFARREGAGQPQEHPQQIAMRAEVERLKGKYSDVIQNRQAYVWADGEVRRRVAKGAQYNERLLDDVAEDARVEFGINGHSARRPPPDQATKARYSGVSAVGRGGGPGQGPQQIVITKDIKKMARSMYPTLSEAQAIQKWANGPGRKMLAQK